MEKKKYEALEMEIFRIEDEAILINSPGTDENETTIVKPFTFFSSNS